MISRRQFIKATAATGVLAGTGLLRPRRAFPFLQTPPGIRKFTMPLNGLGPTGIPVATANTTMFPGSDYYKIVAGEFRQVFHPDFYNIYGNNFGGTKLWGYASENPADLLTNGQPNHRYLGGLIIASKGRPVRLQMRNNLPLGAFVHPVGVDPSVMDTGVITGDDAARENRIAVHLHGGLVPWISDGGPFAWFDPTGFTGASKFDVPDMPAPPPGAMTFYYPNDQSSRLVWYHDHAYGLTRINAYVGLASGYLITDQFEAKLINAGIIPDLAHLVPLIVQDKAFIPPSGNNQTGGRGGPGDLFYPSVYESNNRTDGTGRWDLGSNVSDEPRPPSAIPEFFADTTVINGACYPFLPVEQRHYRFMFLNGSQARFYNLQLLYADSTGTEIPTKPLALQGRGVWQVADLTKVAAGPKMIQIGTEGGFLPFPVALNNPPVPFTAEVDASGSPINPSTFTFNLLLGPAERADVIIDFSHVPAGSKLILYNDAPGPFPGGDPRNDYYTGDPDYTDASKNLDGLGGGAPTTLKGLGPNTRTLMQLQVVPRKPGSKPDPLAMDLLEKIALNGLRGGFLGTTPTTSLLPVIPNLVAKGKPVRRLALYEDFDPYGRLRQLLGGLDGPTEYTKTAGEVVREGDIEVWEIYNTTADTHPMHFHLVDVAILGRAQFVPDADGKPTFDSAGNPLLQTPFRAPDNNERGYKETVRMNPGEMTRVIMKFDLPKTPFAVPLSPRLAQPPYSTNAYEYVWHCHILEHEEHDMMHALSVMPKA